MRRINSARPSVLSSTSTEQLPTQGDQIRDYRLAQRAQHVASRSFQRRFGRGYNRTLESQINPEQQLDISRRRRANMVPAEVLYEASRGTTNHSVYQHYSEQRILCTEGQQINLRFCNERSLNRLRQAGLQHIHLGMMMVRIHTLHRRDAGTNALLVLRDTRWRGDIQIIGTMEVDLSSGTQLVYMTPNMMLSLDDFHNHIEIVVQTHGYDDWVSGESNLLITLAMVGRLSNTSFVGFRYNVQDVADYLATNGVRAIPGQRIAIGELEGRDWRLQPAENQSLHQPSRVAVNTRLDGSISLRFENYRPIMNMARYSTDERDREILHNNEEEDTDEREFTTALAIEELPRRYPQHIPVVGCECQDCYEDSFDDIDEDRHYNKNPKSKAGEIWSTLGEPSGKWDYYVRYDSLTITEPVEEIAATGWDDDFPSDREEEDDKESQYDCLSLFSEAPSENEWLNPFAAERGEGPSSSSIQYNEDPHEVAYVQQEEMDLEYPKLRRRQSHKGRGPICMC